LSKYQTIDAKIIADERLPLQAGQGQGFVHVTRNRSFIVLKGKLTIDMRDGPMHLREASGGHAQGVDTNPGRKSATCCWLNRERSTQAIIIGANRTRGVDMILG
jgi:hypothetical protein